MNLKERKIHIGKKRTISLLSALILVCMLSVTTVLATAYVVLQWTTTATVVANPAVCFYKWSDQTKANTFNYAVNIFPNVKTIDENITYAVYNWEASSRDVYFRLASENTNATDVTFLYYQVFTGNYVGGTVLYSHNETDFGSPDTAWSSVCSAGATTKYKIGIEITAGASAGIGHTPTFTFEIKVENP